MKKNKIPIFYHIPRSGGTYIILWLIAGLQYLELIGEQKNHKIINITKNNNVLGIVLGFDPHNILDNYKISKIKLSQSYMNIDISQVNKFIDKFLVYALVIESNGFRCKDQLFNIINKYDFEQFIVFRKPFEKKQSFFYYLHSHKSNHEPTHGKVLPKTFKEYILNDMGDSWLIRQFAHIKDQDSINSEDYERACSILDSFKIYDIKEIYKVILDMLLIYEVSIQDLIKNPCYYIIKNECNYKKAEFESLPLETQKIFNKLNYWDNKLYNHFIKNK